MGKRFDGVDNRLDKMQDDIDIIKMEKRMMKLEKLVFAKLT